MNIIASVKLNGVRFHNPKMLWIWKSHPVQLVREPQNEYDKRAIAVFMYGKKIGYVAKEQNYALSQMMDNGAFSNPNGDHIVATVKKPREITTGVTVVRSIKFDPIIDIYIGKDEFAEDKFEPEPHDLLVHNVPYKQGAFSGLGTFVYYQKTNRIGFWNGQYSTVYKPEIEIEACDFREGYDYALITSAKKVIAFNGRDPMHRKFNELLG
jgi:hypothetical protein